MTFLGIGPLAVLGLLAVMAAALYALHHLRVRPSVQRVPTLLFWRQAIEESTARHLFERFRHPRTFALLTLLAAAILFALADPTVGADPRRHHVIVIDASAAARVARDGESTFEAMRRAASEWLAGVPLRDAVALVAGERVVAGFEVPRPAVRARLDALRPDSVGPVTQSLRVADALARGRHAPHVIVFAAAPRPVISDAAALEWVAFAIEPTGRALAGVAFTDRLRVRVDAYTADDARRLAVTSSDGAPLAAVELPAIDAPSARWFDVQDVPADGTEVLVRLEPTDGTPHDDVLRYRLPDLVPRSVDVAADLGAVRWLIDADPRLTPATDGARAALAVRGAGGGPGATAGTRVHATADALVDAAASPLPPRLERDVVGLPAGDGVAVLVAGDAVLARLESTRSPPRLVLAADLFGDGALDRARFLRQAWAADWLAAALRAAAGATDGAVGARVDTDTVAMLARTATGATELRRVATRSSAAPFANAPVRLAFAGAPLPAVAARDGAAKPAPSGGWRAWEWFALLAFALAAVDAVLHLRRRIP